jgi:Zn-dependent protease with chaperone function
MMPTTSRLRIVICAAVLLLVASSWAADKPKWSPEYEKKIGSDATSEVEKKWKPVNDEAKLKLLTDIVTTIASVSQRPEVQYTVKIVDTDEVNAFSLPGGFVYVTKGLLKDVQSDDELAGVLAHEITHNTFYESLERADKSKKLFMGSIATALGALLLGAKSQTVSAALAAGEYIRLGVLCTFSLDVESRADSYAIRYLIASRKYNPVGMLTFMERLAAQERHKPKQELGVYADHPDTEIRCKLIADQLEASDVEINRRAVTKWDPAKAEEKDVSGKKIPVATLWGFDIFKVQAATDSPAAMDRAKAIADTLTKALAGGLAPYQISADTSAGQPRVLLGHQVLLTVTSEDAQAAGLAAPELAQQVVTNLGTALRKEELDRWW